MANKQNLPNRVARANAAQMFASVQSYDKQDKVKTVVLPGTDGKQYLVIIRRKIVNKKRTITTELFLLVDNQLVKTNYSRQITYHTMATIQIAADEQGYKVTWTANKQDAKNLSNLGGTVFKVTAFDNPTSVMWGVMKEK